MAEAELVALAAKRHGVVSREDALRHGFTPYRVRKRVAEGAWRELFPGAYVIGGAPASFDQTAWAALAWAGDDAAISHRAAAFVHGWLEKAPGVELTIPLRRALNADGVKVHRSDLRSSPRAAEEVKVRRGLRVTDPERTLIDLAGDPRAAKLVEAALHLSPYLAASVPKRLKAMGRTTATGVGQLKAMLQEYRPSDDVTDSLLETKFRKLLRKAGLEGEHHVELAGAEGAPLLESDFAWLKEKVVVECDGRKAHDNPRAHAARATVQRKLAALGWQLIPVTWDEVTRNPDELIADLKRAISLRARSVKK